MIQLHMQKSKHNTAKCANSNNYEATFVHIEGDHLQIELHTCSAGCITLLWRVKIDQSLCHCHATIHGSQLGSLRTTMALQARHLSIKTFYKWTYQDTIITLQKLYTVHNLLANMSKQTIHKKLHPKCMSKFINNHNHLIVVKVYIISGTHANTSCQT